MLRQNNYNYPTLQLYKKLIQYKVRVIQQKYYVSNSKSNKKIKYDWETVKARVLIRPSETLILLLTS